MSEPEHVWVVRSGNDNEIANEVWDKNAVAIGWFELGDLSDLNTREAVKARYREVYETNSKYRVGVNSGQLFRFSHKIKQGDYILTYIKSSREIYIGIVDSPYFYKPGYFSVDSYAHVRKVNWLKAVSRDDFSAAARNSLGSTLTMFNIDDHLEEVKKLAQTEVITEPVISEEQEEETPRFYEDTKAKADELIADIISRLDPYDFQDLVAGVLEAMGFNAVSSPPGPDRGIDIVAHPDAFGFEDPKIKVQVKHRKSTATGPEMREFLGTLQPNDNGLYVSTGGFTKDAQLEADTSRHSVSLLDREEFIEIMLENYDRLSSTFKAQIPLKQIWLPIE